MVELLRYLEANGFTTYIASGGDRDFMRPFAEQLYGIPPERVIGSSLGLEFHVDDDGTDLLYKAKIEFFDDGPEKPVRIWSRIGRRPVVAGGNSNGDVPMLRFARSPTRPALRLLVRHDDADREFAYDDGAEDALDRAGDAGLDRRERARRLVDGVRGRLTDGGQSGSGAGSGWRVSSHVSAASSAAAVDAPITSCAGNTSTGPSRPARPGAPDLLDQAGGDPAEVQPPAAASRRWA